MSSNLQVAVVERRDTVVVLAVTGELDMRTSSRFLDVAQGSVDTGHPDVILDLVGVPFCDSSGLNALVLLYRRLHAAGGSLALAQVPDRLARLLSLTGVDRLIPSHLTTKAALAARSTTQNSHPAS
ncbi:STAS domain-containing protein [Actinomadura namibiensis]|uniref:Anti-sigma factor antagonist n=1 Tax=Actinomadura namibiensis TaxID=182080 RepID=A0A7W3QN54_ACTNM|nr:STAS domain-containing protein [Actinomadura namibiensis]MBA8953201.1 anti-sigma B factor antagonist [Actinomadura namibiensis]